MESRLCTQCNIEKHINNFYTKSSKCKYCNIKRGVKRYFNNKDEISIQQKIYYDKKKEINYYRNKKITEIKEAQIINKYIELMLNYKIN